MSLYYLQKLLYELNRDPRTRARFEADREGVLADYELTEEERAAILKPDIGLLYIVGVNGQILMHYATQCGYSWTEYLDAMRQALAEHGQVRDGIYAFVRD
jgi:hypothetical protein